MPIANVFLPTISLSPDSSLFFFFFSSRRRHTRFKCDWNSDVCSSDLGFPSEDAALQRACAWGIVAANRSQIEYRLFAASVVCLLNTQINTSVRDNLTELEAFGNDICYKIGRASCRERV